ncbi:hypothetical protein Gobs01_00614 [Geodermatophilus obscurus DSM 43160]|uniref:DUF6779 domain-containing protein n=1 Tax=Geodermatophilus obscurus (strain ATCC 25078 / DSM 43160 / JCM 3152 / CCUG 61914 / KCC A-0152 / KCTC 9177 / NBRC 13315 / NRRL B-3577 / G-20) TaxID=526225 RepID=D2S7A8_GEOOG|nr:hypothetical protein Gobs_0629 [Geodermatophilus obscurus DSM 43160]
MRTAGLVAGFCLAVAATVVVFITEDPRVLRLAVGAAAWAFVLAALVRSRSTADVSLPAREQLAAAEREAELRLAHELELGREAAARREHELRVDDLRRTAEPSMRAELEALRTELAQVTGLRREMSQVAELRGELAGLAELRRELAGLAELRTTLAELRTDVGRLRSELTEQLSGEMLVERVMLRTQTTRTAPVAPEPAAPHTVEADGSDRPASELTAARPAVRVDEPAPGTRRPEEVRVEPQRPVAPPPPRDWPARRSLLDAAPPPHAEPDPPRCRTDDPLAVAVPAEQLTDERPVAQWERPPVPGLAAPVPTAAALAPLEGSAPVEEESARRLAELLAEGGLTPPSGGRRRRRYREDGGSDDVLARVLGRS